MSAGVHHVLNASTTVQPSSDRPATANGVNGAQTNGVNGHTSLNGQAAEFKLGEFSIDEYRPIKVVVIGTGFSGITAGIR